MGSSEIVRSSWAVSRWFSARLLRRIRHLVIRVVPSLGSHISSKRSDGWSSDWIYRALALVVFPFAGIRTIWKRVLPSRNHGGRRVLSGPPIEVGASVRSVLFFGPIDWAFRFQRPQHLALQLADVGFRVMYVDPTIHSGHRHSVQAVPISDGVQVLSMAWPRGSSYSLVSGFPVDSGQALARQLQELLVASGSGNAVLVVTHPMWLSVVKHLSHYRTIYDCMDLHSGFEVKNADVASIEEEMLRFADGVTVSSAHLAEHLSDRGRPDVVTIRNAVEHDHFVAGPVGKKSSAGRRVGYFGAVAEWFDVDAIQSVVDHCPDLEIAIAGEVSGPALKQHLGGIPRVQLLGEIPYAQLPEFCRTIEVGVIPFKVTDLIMATNPVKMYEYAAAGLPIVTSRFPEAVRASKEVPGVFVASGPAEFGALVQKAVTMRETVRDGLVSWARENAWSARTAQLLPILVDFPLVSIIILMWNRSALTINCVDSVLRRSGYPNLEIIVVDNDSHQSESEIISSWITREASSRVRYVRTSENLGFAGGNNVGIQESHGDFIILLNNDTEVLFGWVQRAIRHFRLNQNLGLLGVSTDNIGNEGRVTCEVPAGQPWQAANQERFGLREPTLIPAKTVAFFCVILPRSTLEDVGLLDEIYGVGMFEDDDYCRRVEQKSLEIAIARDIFVHHEHQASFSDLGSARYTDLFQRNRAAYESRWGRWIPHTYGNDPDAFR